MKAVTDSLAVAIGLLLLAASLGKIDAWRRWKETATALFTGPNWLARGLAFVIPVTEGLIALLVLVRPRLGLVLAAALFLSLAVGVIGLAHRSSGTPCACFGAMMPSNIGPMLAARNLGLAVLAAGIALGGRPERISTSYLGIVAVVTLYLVLFDEYRRMPRISIRQLRAELVEGDQ